jgi:hypothetical protein
MRAGDFNQILAELPAPFRATSPHTVEVRERSRFVAALVGAPFFLAGLFMALSLIGVLPYEAEPKRDWDFLLLPLLSIVFLGIGGVLLFGHRWLKLDLANGSVTRQTGLLFAMRSEVRRFSEFKAVVISFDPGGSESPDRYPVRLRAASGTDFVVTTPLQFSEARKQAEYLSRSLGLPLADTTTDHETVVSPAKAGYSLRDLLMSGEAEAEHPTPPPRMLSKITESSNEATIVIPGPKFPVSAVLGLLAPAVILLLVVTGIVPGYPRNIGARSIALAFMILVLIFGVLGIAGRVNLRVGSKRRRTTVKASRSGLVIESRGVWRTRLKAVSALEILDIDQSTFKSILKSAKNSVTTAVAPDAASRGLLAILRKWVPTKGIVVKSRQELITFGEGLPASELQYLRWVLRKALVGG